MMENRAEAFLDIKPIKHVCIILLLLKLKLLQYIKDQMNPLWKDYMHVKR